ncbi:hypothetical protein [Rossellomorea aquimaris]|uniref:hypothetical protein n=1 Tax=Rossellomorea aquimaris TaxID=189382 RepID=UPI0009F967AF|nr:hypothetical protein [Rossellomorea aquimaris]
MTDKPKVLFLTPGSFPIPSPESSSVETVVEKVAAALHGKADVHIADRQKDFRKGKRSAGPRITASGSSIGRSMS